MENAERDYFFLIDGMILFFLSMDLVGGTSGLVFLGLGRVVGFRDVILNMVLSNTPSLLRNQIIIWVGPYCTCSNRCCLLCGCIIGGAHL